MMTYSQTGLHLTEQFEGCPLTAYWDALGQCWTIGYGHTGPDVHEGLVWTQEQAEDALQNDIHWAVNVVNSLVKVSLTQGEFDALVDFVFNLGVTRFRNSTMLMLLNAGRMNEAAGEFEKWDRAGGQVVAGILRRRTAEKDEFA